MSCIAACPAEGALALRIGPRTLGAAVPPWALAAGILVLFLGIVGLARATGSWHTSLPDVLYFELIPRASAFAHPH
jgi:hypothetical protein